MKSKTIFAFMVFSVSVFALAQNTHHHAHLQASTTAPTIQATITPNQDIQPNQATDFTLHLHRKNNQQPVTPDDLQEMHTKKIHLLIIDPSLTDYHHEHPIPTQVPGDYTFTITPTKGGIYKAFVELTPNESNSAIYLPVELTIHGKAEPVVPNSAAKSGQLQKAQEINGFVFTTTIDTQTLKAHQAYTLDIHISDAKTQKPVTILEPVMGAFAHMVGFSQDRKQIVHVHPIGKKPLQSDARGGPNLSFSISFPTSGFYRLFAQVQIRGEMIFVPLDVQVL